MEGEEEESLDLGSEGNVRTGEEEPGVEAVVVRSWSANLRRASPIWLSEWKYATCAAARA